MNFFQLNASKEHTEKPQQSDFLAHTHDTYELFFFMTGSAEYSVEGNIYPLSHGDLILLDHLETHHLILKKSSPYTRISVHFKPTANLSSDFYDTLMSIFHDRPHGCFNLFPSRKFPENHWSFYLNAMCQTTDTVKQQIYLMSLLLELSDFYPKVKTLSTLHFTNRILNITHYIDMHLTETITLDQLCEHFFISKAQLNRNFKANLGTTAGEYILTKRLVMAKNLIQQGQKPSSVYLQCGFNDYSTFFKAYKKKFGHSPKEEKVSIT